MAETYRFIKSSARPRSLCIIGAIALERDLFSDHCLDNLLPQEPRWTEFFKTSEVSEDLGGLRVLDRRDAGQVYLETDRGERKATGSYYTPQYIVEYIVDNTLGPLVDEAVERVKARAKRARGKAAHAEAEQSLRRSSGQALRWDSGQALVDEILSLKVLDPAMGSGHFLAEATEYLALELATDPYVETEVPVKEDLIHWKRRVVEQRRHYSHSQSKRSQRLPGYRVC